VTATLREAEGILAILLMCGLAAVALKGSFRAASDGIFRSRARSIDAGDTAPIEVPSTVPPAGMQPP
jgi:hypothetical protein